MGLFKTVQQAKNVTRKYDFIGLAAFKRERQLALNSIRSIVSNPLFNDIVSIAGNIANRSSNLLGPTRKAVGPFEELPTARRNNPAAADNTQRIVNHKAQALLALSKTPDPAELSIYSDIASLSLGTLVNRNDLANKYYPFAPYTLQNNSIYELANTVFKFNIVNTAAIESDLGSGSGSRFTSRRVTGKKEIFPAFIKNLNDSVQASWNSQEYLGRSEPTYHYKGAERTFNLDFMLFATEHESSGRPDSIKPYLDVDGYTIVNLKSVDRPNLYLEGISKEDLWRKINFLYSCYYPQYDTDGFYVRAPVLKLTIGSFYQNQLAIFDSLTITPEPIVWDLNDRHITPMIFNIAIAGKIIHEKSPGYTVKDGFVLYRID